MFNSYRIHMPGQGQGFCSREFRLLFVFGIQVNADQVK